MKTSSSPIPKMMKGKSCSAKTKKKVSQDEEEYAASIVRVQTDLCHTRQGNSTDKHKAISSEQTVSNGDEKSYSVGKVISW